MDFHPRRRMEKSTLERHLCDHAQPGGKGMDSHRITKSRHGNHQLHLMWLVWPRHNQGQHGANKERPGQPSRLGTNPQNWWFIADFRFGGAARSAPSPATTSNFCREDDQARSALSAAVLLPLTGWFQDGTIDISAPWTRGSISVQC